MNVEDEPLVDGIGVESKFPDHTLMDKDDRRSVNCEVKESDLGEEISTESKCPHREDHNINHSISSNYLID